MWGDRHFRQIMNYGQGKRGRCGLLAVSIGTVRAHLVSGTEHLGDTYCYVMYPKFCIGFKIRKSRCKQLLLSGSGHSK